MARDSNPDDAVAIVLAALDEIETAIDVACLSNPATMQTVITRLQRKVDKGKEAARISPSNETAEPARTETRFGERANEVVTINNVPRNLSNGEFLLFVYAFIKSRPNIKTCKEDIYDKLIEMGLQKSSKAACLTRIARINSGCENSPLIYWQTNSKKPPLVVTSEGNAHFEQMLGLKAIGWIDKKELEGFLPIIDTILPGTSDRSRTLRG